MVKRRRGGFNLGHGLLAGMGSFAEGFGSAYQAAEERAWRAKMADQRQQDRVDEMIWRQSVEEARAPQQRLLASAEADRKAAMDSLRHERRVAVEADKAKARAKEREEERTWREGQSQARRTFEEEQARLRREAADTRSRRSNAARITAAREGRPGLGRAEMALLQDMLRRRQKLDEARGDPVTMNMLGGPQAVAAERAKLGAEISALMSRGGVPPRRAEPDPNALHEAALSALRTQGVAQPSPDQIRAAMKQIRGY